MITAKVGSLPKHSSVKTSPPAILFKPLLRRVIKMVFCYQNCSRDRENFLKIEAEGREFAKILRSLEQFVRTVKGQNNFC